MVNNKIYTLEELEQKIEKYDLIQLYLWLPEDRLVYLKKELIRIGSDKRRKVFIVRKFSKYSLFVDNIAGKIVYEKETKD